MSKDQKEKKAASIRSLLFETETQVCVINIITLYRIITFPLLVSLILTNHANIFKWLLLASFATDAVDGFLARKYSATSILGAKLDSVGDDLTVLAAVIGLFVTKLDFIAKELTLILILFSLFFIQVTLALTRYRRLSSFHTYLAKIAAVIQAIFLLSVFFLDKVFYPFFYASFISTAIDLVEEIIIIFFLPTWKTNVKGLYWLLKAKAQS